MWKTAFRKGYKIYLVHSRILSLIFSSQLSEAPKNLNNYFSYKLSMVFTFSYRHFKLWLKLYHSCDSVKVYFVHITSSYKKIFFINSFFIFNNIRDHLQILLLILSKFNRINQLLFPLKSSENSRLFDAFRGNTSLLIRLNSLNIRSKIWRQTIICLDHKWIFL